MKRTRRSDRHLDTRSALDYLDQKLDARSRRATEEHLGRPCPMCRERLRELGALLELMRGDSTAEVPAWLHARATSVFHIETRSTPVQRLLGSLATLLFDSLSTPASAGARRSVGEARRLSFQLGEGRLELEVDRESAQTVQLRGWLEVADPALHDLRVTVGEEQRRVQPDSAGSFVEDHVPLGAIEILIEGPGGSWHLPVIE